jgi:hypothetical protein
MFIVGEKSGNLTDGFVVHGHAMMVDFRDTETGDPARLPAQVAGRWGLVSEKMWHEKNNILHIQG